MTVAIAFTVASQLIPDPWKPYVLFLSIVLLVLAGSKWLSLHFNWSDKLAKTRLGNSKSMIIFAAIIGAIAGTLLWLGIRPAPDVSSEKMEPEMPPHQIGGSKQADQNANIDLEKRTFEEQLRQFNLINRPVITLTPAKFKDEVFLHFEPDTQDYRGVIAKIQIGIKNVGKIPTRVVSMFPSAISKNSTTGETKVIPVITEITGFALAPDQEVFGVMQIRLEFPTVDEAKRKLELFSADKEDAFTIDLVMQYSGISDKTSKYIMRAIFRARKESVATVLMEYKDL